MSEAHLTYGRMVPPAPPTGGGGRRGGRMSRGAAETSVFGYDVSDLVLTRPPSPPQGNSILNDREQHDINHFLSNLDTSNFGEGLNVPELNFTEEWFSEALPPTYIGHTTHFGQQPPLNLAQQEIQGMSPSILNGILQFQPDLMPPPPPPQSQPQQPIQSPIQHLQHQQQQPQLHTQPMLQHMFQQQAHQQQHPGMTSYMNEHNTHADAAAVLTRMQNSNSSHINHGRQPSHQDSAALLSGFGIPAHTIPRQQSVPSTSTSQGMFRAVDYGMTGTSTRPLTEQTEYKFGSDNQFDGPQGYRRPQHESHEALSRRGVELVRTLHLERDHSNEGVSSARHSDQSSLNGVHETHNGDIEEENEATPPRKRRKSKAKGEDERNDNESSSGVGILNGLTKKRKPKADLALDTAQASTSAAAPAAGQNTPKKRRKSAITNPIPNGKTPRENLTDAQKRENHIQSEKKRRGAITEGYEGLKWIVPGLIEESSSKSITLQKAGEWVEELKESNRLLKQRLDAMGG